MAGYVLHRHDLRLATVVAIALALSLPASAQTPQSPTPQLGRILGTVTDMKGDPVVSATVVLACPDSTDRSWVVTP